MYLSSEFPINADGTCFHLHLHPNDIADKIILVGDPGRVDTVAAHFQKTDIEVSSREFHTITGWYTPDGTSEAKHITVLSTGIGCDNIDIVINELDALANIDFETRDDNQTFRKLSLVRLGTCGAIQPEAPTGTFIASVKSIGFDGLLNYYADRDKVCDLALEEAFRCHMDWSDKKGAPYVVTADPELVNRIAGDDMLRGITVACGGFYGPQGRQIRMKAQDPHQNEKLHDFQYKSTDSSQPSILKITNIEMESSALAGLSAILGHSAMTCCMVVANRYTHAMNTGYKSQIDDLIKLVLNRI